MAPRRNVATVYKEMNADDSRSRFSGAVSNSARLRVGSAENELGYTLDRAVRASCPPMHLTTIRTTLVRSICPSSRDHLQANPAVIEKKQIANTHVPDYFRIIATDAVGRADNGICHVTDRAYPRSKVNSTAMPCRSAPLQP